MTPTKLCLGSDRRARRLVLVHAAQASFMSAAMPVCGNFYYFILTLFETGIWVVRAEKGHDGNAEKRHGKLLPWKVTFLKGITAMAEGIDGNCRRCRRVISGAVYGNYYINSYVFMYVYMNLLNKWSWFIIHCFWSLCKHVLCTIKALTNVVINTGIHLKVKLSANITGIPVFRLLPEFQIFKIFSQRNLALCLSSGREKTCLYRAHSVSLGYQDVLTFSFFMPSRNALGHFTDIGCSLTYVNDQ